MEETIEVRFANDAKDYALNQGVNRGYLVMYHKFAKCLFLSEQAKMLYHLLEIYASYNDEKVCFPSRDTIKSELGGWGNDKLDRAINDLKSAKLLETTKRTGYSTLYKVFDLQYSPVIAHSELVHSLKIQWKKQGKHRQFHSALTKYRNSELFIDVTESMDSLSFQTIISNWFEQFIKEETEIIKEETPLVPKPFIGNIVNVDVERSSSDPIEEKQKAAKKSKDHNEVEIAEWNTNHFISYFESLWEEQKNLPYPRKMKEDLGAMKHVITQLNNKEKVKKMLEVYFENPEFNTPYQSIRNFSSSSVQQKLIFALNSPNSNSYKKSTKKPNDPGVDEEWLKDFLGE